jgi:hypothetical protein
MGYDERGGRRKNFAESRFNSRFGFNIECGKRVVEHENLWGRRDCSGECEALALPAGEAQTLFANDGVDAVGKVVHKIGLGN